MKSLLRKHSEARCAFASTLQKHARATSGEPEEQNAAMASVYRFVLSLQTGPSRHDAS